MVNLTSRITLVCLILAGVAHGQAKDPWVGVKVITKYTTPLRVENRVVDDGYVFRIYTVEQTDGDRLHLVSGSVKGWVQASDVVPFAEAIDFYTTEIRNNPGNSTAYNARAIIRRNKGDLDGAFADYDEAIRLDPNYALAYNSRGAAWGAKKGFDRAIADFGEAIRLDPKNAWAYYNRGNAWQDKKDFDRAIADYDEAIRLDPKNATAYYSRGNASGAKKDFDRAIADFGKAIRLDPKYADAYYNRAWFWATCPDEKIRDGKKAIESAAKACELTSWKDPSYIDTLAASHAEAGNFDQAVKWQQEAIKLEPADSDYVKGYQERLALYRDKKPYRQP